MKNIERLISVFDKFNGDILQEIDVSYLTIDQLKKIFKQMPNDYSFVHVYPIGKDESIFFENLLNTKFNLEMFIYQLDCFYSR